MFSSIQNTDKNHAAFTYGWADDAVITGSANQITGAFLPMAVDPSGFLKVAIANATFTGEFNIENNVTISGQNVILAVTGINNASPSGYVIQSGLLQTAGLAVVTSGFAPQYGSGVKAPFAIDNINGGALSVLSDLDRSIDSITTYPANATTVSNYIPSGNLGTTIVTGNVLLANPNRIAWGIQNVGSGSLLYLKFGSAPAGSGSFNMLLKASAADFGADGGSFLDSPAMYLGDVSISGSTRFTVWEM